MGRDLLSLHDLIEPFGRAFRYIDKHPVPFPSPLPFREGRSLLRGGFQAGAACCGVGSKGPGQAPKARGWVPSGHSLLRSGFQTSA